MAVLARLASYSVTVLVIVCIAMAAQDTDSKTAENKVDKSAGDKAPKDTEAKAKTKMPDHCTKDGEVDWLALAGKLLEMYQNYKPSKSSGGSPLEEALLSAFKGDADTSAPKASTDSHTSDSKRSSSSAQPDASAALLGSIISNLAKAGTPSKKGGAADPMDGLKGILDGLSALNGKGSTGGTGADSLDFSKLAPLVLQMLPSLLGKQSGGSQPNILSLLAPLLGGQQEGGQVLEKLVSQGLQMLFNDGKSGKDDSHGPSLDSLLSLAELFTKDTLKEDSSEQQDTPKSKLKTEL